MFRYDTFQKENNKGADQSAQMSRLVSLFVVNTPQRHWQVFSCRGPYITRVKVFRIIPEFRILRLTFHRKSSSKYWIRLLWLLWLIFSIAEDNWSFKLEIVNITSKGIQNVFRFEFPSSGFWKFAAFTHYIIIIFFIYFSVNFKTAKLIDELFKAETTTTLFTLHGECWIR